MGTISTFFRKLFGRPTVTEKVIPQDSYPRLTSPTPAPTIYPPVEIQGVNLRKTTEPPLPFPPASDFRHYRNLFEKPGALALLGSTGLKHLVENTDVVVAHDVMMDAMKKLHVVLFCSTDVACKKAAVHLDDFGNPVFVFQLIILKEAEKQNVDAALTRLTVGTPWTLRSEIAVAGSHRYLFVHLTHVLGVK